MDLKHLICCIIVSSGLSGCALVAPNSGSDLRRVGQSTYCGTSSQDSTARYFSNQAAYDRWIERRAIGGLQLSSWPERGVLVVEMGQRPTGGYDIVLDSVATKIEDETLQLVMSWTAPRADAAVSQALIAPCKAFALPAGDYRRVRVLDQLGEVRGNVSLDGAS